MSCLSKSVMQQENQSRLRARDSCSKNEKVNRLIVQRVHWKDSKVLHYNQHCMKVHNQNQSVNKIPIKKTFWDK